MQLFSNDLEEEEDLQIENMNKKLAYIKKDNQKKEDEKQSDLPGFIGWTSHFC